jgi:hypothetical protein
MFHAGEEADCEAAFLLESQPLGTPLRVQPAYRLILLSMSEYFKAQVSHGTR